MMLISFRHVASFVMLLMSSIVVFLNFRVIRNMRLEKEGFHKICVNKAFANFLMGSAFLIWSTPCSLLNYLYLPHPFNIFFGEIVGWAPYLMSGPFTQICLAVNRSVAIFSPYHFSRTHRLPYTKLVLVGLWILAIVLSLPALREGCSFIYYPESVSWGSMDTDCSRDLSGYITNLVMIMAATSFTINVISIGKILKNAKNTGISENVSASRKRKRTKMFIQCVIQDCTHTLDCLINTYVYTFYDFAWFQFLCGTVSPLTVISLDGFLMSFLHQKSYTPNASEHNLKFRNTTRMSTSHIATVL